MSLTGLPGDKSPDIWLLSKTRTRPLPAKKTPLSARLGASSCILGATSWAAPKGQRTGVSPGQLGHFDKHPLLICTFGGNLRPIRNVSEVSVVIIVVELVEARGEMGGKEQLQLQLRENLWLVVEKKNGKIKRRSQVKGKVPFFFSPTPSAVIQSHLTLFSPPHPTLTFYTHHNMLSTVLLFTLPSHHGLFCLHGKYKTPTSPHFLLITHHHSSHSFSPPVNNYHDNLYAIITPQIPPKWMFCSRITILQWRGTTPREFKSLQ